ncbi:hypothetical protein AAFN60_04875 [Roseibacillus persicicus]|uniref:hypothetical protein n=1 Tax=Roseibacillus persicicus TaxID=454148 RepID=UPI00398BB380
MISVLARPLFTFLVIGGVSLGHGQDLSSQRLDSKLDRRAVQSAGTRSASTKEGLDISLVTSLAYDNNIFQTSDNETASAVAQIEPTIGWTVGERDKAWLRLAYEGAVVLYLSRQEDSRIDNRVTMEGGIKGKSVALAYSARWAKLGSPSADIGGASDRYEWGGGIEAVYSPKGKVSYIVSADRSVIDLVEPGFFDFYQSSFGIAAAYRYSPKTEVELAYRIGKIEVDGAGSQTYQRFGTQVNWAPRSKLRFSLAGGLEHRNYESGSGSEPYLAARVDWTPRAKTAFFLEAYRREETSSALEGENYKLVGIRAGVNQRLRDGWSVALEAGRESADYFNVVGGDSSGREDTITYIRPSVRYALSEDAEIAFLYQWSKNDSSDPGFGYSNQQLGLSMNYRF